ncbi:CPBP family intramembrane metalloprotease [Lysinibacillus sp. MHQ-1]|nr:CPBP family intramembrane metalloprotease [Lysinibacillus sp. MHQ-1]
MIGIWAAIVSGIVEEVVFRHLLMEYVLSIGFSNLSQVIISGIAFGIAHGAWVLLRGEMKIALPAILSTTILGCLLAMLYIYTGRSTFAPIVAHILINMVIEPWLMLAAISGKWQLNKN